MADNENLARLHSVEIEAISAEPLIGRMLLDVDGDKTLLVHINRAVAELMIEELTTFLDTEEAS